MAAMNDDHLFDEQDLAQAADQLAVDYKLQALVSNALSSPDGREFLRWVVGPRFANYEGTDPIKIAQVHAHNAFIHTVMRDIARLAPDRYLSLVTEEVTQAHANQISRTQP